MCYDPVNTDIMMKNIAFDKKVFLSRRNTFSMCFVFLMRTRPATVRM